MRYRETRVTSRCEQDARVLLSRINDVQKIRKFYNMFNFLRKRIPTSQQSPLFPITYSTLLYPLSLSQTSLLWCFRKWMEPTELRPSFAYHHIILWIGSSVCLLLLLLLLPLYDEEQSMIGSGGEGIEETEGGNGWVFKTDG